MNGNLIKGLGIAATAIGMGATLLTNWIDEKKMDAKIKEAVSEALANQNNEDEES